LNINLGGHVYLIEKLIIKAALLDKSFLNMVTSSFDAKYFEDSVISDVFQQLKEYNSSYSKIAPRSVISDAVKDSNELFSEIDSIDFDIPDNYDYLINTTNAYLKKAAVKNAILDSVEVINKEEDIAQVRLLVEDALCKDLKIDLGLDYFDTWGARIARIRSQGDHRVPTFYPQFDEYINGGFPPYTLSVMLSRVHGGKCVCGDTLIKIKNIITNKIENITIGDFYDNYINRHEGKYRYRRNIKMPSKNQFINKHGEIEGIKRYEKFVSYIKKRTKGMNTLAGFITRYGEEDGTKRYNEKNEKISKKNTGNVSPYKGISILILFINKYGDIEGTKRYDEYIRIKKDKLKVSMKGHGTLSWYVNKYGEHDGTKRYNEYITNLKKSLKGVNSRTWYVEKYGETEGIKRYEEKNRKISDPGRGTLPWFTKKYGKEEGQKRHSLYIERQKLSSKRSVEHWKSQGYTDDEAVLLVKQNQSTFTKKKCIEKYGEKKGLEIWKKRQEKWQNTMNSKPKEEIERINKAKMFKRSYSQISQELFWKIYDNIKDKYDEIYFAQLKSNKMDISGKSNEYMNIFKDGSAAFFDFLIRDTNKIIEFDGDYWHGEARGNKERDRIRDEKIKESGYKILHIREKDYNNNPNDVIKRCLEFING